MQTKEAPIKSNMIEAVLKKQRGITKAEKAEEELSQAWESFQRKLELDLEGTAKESKALQRKREVPSAKDLLRLILFYVTSDWSLRLVRVWALLTAIGYLSDVAVLKRLRNSKTWLGQLPVIIMQTRISRSKNLPEVRLRVVDATTISIPGSRSTDWRIHLSFDLRNLCLDRVEITDKHREESLARFEAQSNKSSLPMGHIRSLPGWHLYSIAGQG